MQKSTTQVQNGSVESPRAIVEIAGFRTADGMEVIAIAANPFETEDAFVAVEDIEDAGVHERVADLIDEEKLEGQTFASVNPQTLCRLTVGREIEKAEFNGDLLAEDSDPYQFDVPTEVV